MKYLCGLFSALCLSMSLAASSSPARSETVVYKTVSYFTIGGTSLDDLDRELNNRGPYSNQTGHRHPGMTHIKFSPPVVKFDTSDNSCRVISARVSVSTKLILPRWANRGHASSRVGLIWDTLSSDIKRHEERHAEIARTHARALERTIEALSPASNCATLKSRIDRAVLQELSDHEKDQQRFDRIEAVNFDNRMIRLLRYRMGKNPVQ